MQWIEANLSQSISKSRIRFSYQATNHLHRFIKIQQMYFIPFLELFDYFNFALDIIFHFFFSKLPLFENLELKKTILIKFSKPPKSKSQFYVKSILFHKKVCVYVFICASLCVNIQHQSWFTTMFNIMMARRWILIQKQQNL